MRTLVQILIRQANTNAPSDPTGWLETLQSTKWSTVNTQSGQIIGTSVNGKSVSLQVLPGFSLADVLTATEIALQTLETGLTSPPTEYQGLSR